jgi:hypothetical protein
MPRARDVISSDVRATLERIWRGELEPSALTDTTRQAIIDFYRVVGDHNPAGSAQREYVHARADYLAGMGPNPGPNLNDFAAAHGHVKAIKFGPRRNF